MQFKYPRLLNISLPLLEALITQISIWNEARSMFTVFRSFPNTRKSNPNKPNS